MGGAAREEGGPERLKGLLLVALGGAAGSILRYSISAAAVATLGAGFPWGTLAVNAAGSTAIGALASLGVQGDARLLLVTGLLGGFTTFSAFSLETMTLWQRAPWLAVLYVAASLGAGFAGFAAGHGLAATRSGI
ncbi:fluoride efflux transporter CrcB [Craurococcus roseus]|uniref:Fluoride-specific ion channel FluC n=1 Tax=Craurococcus roseus TaxID=77585 RepID=A0ABP3Q193_9PROT